VTRSATPEEPCVPRAVEPTAEPRHHPFDSDPAGELRRQTDVLVAQGYPALAGLTGRAFRGRVAPLADVVPPAPFVLVVTGELVPLDRLVERTALRGKRGFTTMDGDDVRRFRPTPGLDLPASPVYLLVDVDTGAETLGVTPDDALPGIHASGRTPLTLDEGLAVVAQHPQWLRERNCFEMLGSRAGDRRVTGLWLSKGAPRLGWCWAGNPHGWLGMATAAGRVGRGHDVGMTA
jgi:hypothetical protein